MQQNDSLTGGCTKASALPGGIRAALQPGQTMFWDGDTIHRGNYRDYKERLTLHNSWGSIPAASQGAEGRKKTVRASGP